MNVDAAVLDPNFIVQQEAEESCQYGYWNYTTVIFLCLWKREHDKQAHLDMKGFSHIDFFTRLPYAGWICRWYVD